MQLKSKFLDAFRHYVSNYSQISLTSQQMEMQFVIKANDLILKNQKTNFL